VTAATPAESPADQRSVLHRMVFTVYAPVVTTETGNGAATPVIAITAFHLGASAGVAALSVALLGIGRVFGDIPASIIADRLGDRRSMMVAATISMAAYTVCFVSPTLVVFAAGVLVAGMANATFYLARQSYVIESVTPSLRARALSALGGSHRIGLFFGPLVGAGVISLTDMKGAYAAAIAANLLTFLLLVLVTDGEPRSRATERVSTPQHTNSVSVFREHWRLFVTLGMAVTAVGAVRSARQTVIPLWSVHIGLDAARTSLVFAAASCVEMALFYPAGKVMDLYGRLALDGDPRRHDGATADEPQHRHAHLAGHGDELRQRHRGRHHDDPGRRCRPRGRPAALPRDLANARRHRQRRWPLDRLAGRGGGEPGHRHRHRRGDRPDRSDRLVDLGSALLTVCVPWASHRARAANQRDYRVDRCPVRRNGMTTPWLPICVPMYTLTSTQCDLSETVETRCLG
jgi:MFS family permease